jgi:uncharacterized protein with NRDE domain
MCLVSFCIIESQSSPYSFVLVANRDEVLDRPTETLHFWPLNSENGAHALPIYAGRDMQGGGTWLALSKTGKFAYAKKRKNFIDS